MPNQPTTPAVEIVGVTKRFGPVAAVADLSLRIQPGEVVAFLGPNGAGKTTTIDMMLGLSQPSRGQIRVYGRSPRAAVARGVVGAVMQSGGLLKDFTVAETVRLVGSLYRPARTVAEVLERAGITELADRRVGKGLPMINTLRLGVG